jgi:transposase InsO family protein
VTEEEMTPRDDAEAVALFRAQIVGELVARDLDRGELRAALREKSQQRFRPPNSLVTRTYSVPTLERWYYALRVGGIDALRPTPRSDRGAARALTDELRTLLLDIRRDHPSMSAALILDTLERLGRVERGAVSSNTVRRLFRRHGVSRVSKKHTAPGKERRRWEAPRPGVLWHADVCHGPKLTVGDTMLPLRIHGLLDDHSRYVVALVARHTEQEVDMLAVWTDAVRRWGTPTTLYLDNGSTYRGDVLRIACERLDVRLVHAQPYDPQARGKMERLWRTLRERCLDHLPATATLHDVQMRLYAFLDEWYHQRPHASLVGQTPAQRWATRELPAVDEARLRDSLVVRTTRRVSNDGVISVGGRLWEVSAGFLAGAKVVVERSLATPDEAPWIAHDDNRLPLTPVRVLDNARRRRAEPPKKGAAVDLIPFDPMQPLVNAAVGRKPTSGGES